MKKQHFYVIMGCFWRWMRWLMNMVNCLQWLDVRLKIEKDVEKIAIRMKKLKIEERDLELEIEIEKLEL